ncbi:TnsA endonuclease N-terminal domain-containing protein [Phaeobacter sp. JH20_02]|uniref:Tn7 transposase TnsA N-terminal domain-containing protein n=1 Tax=unclassified Phaeobacter TaxID=2621772 RepID=UPI003A8BB90E
MPSDQVIDHDSWNHSPAKLPRQSKITLGNIHGVLPFDGKRTPSFRSSVAHRVWVTYRTAANGYKPKVGIGESAAEVASAHELLIAPDLHDLRFQPLTVPYTNAFGKKRRYTHDLLATFVDGRRRLIFVRNSDSLSKPQTWRDIEAIRAATPRDAADDMIVVNAGDYSRQRRENLFRLHEAIQQPDDETDDIVLWTARNHTRLWLMRDLFPQINLPQSCVFRSCYRLIARRKLVANLDNVIAEWSRIGVAQ